MPWKLIATIVIILLVIAYLGISAYIAATLTQPGESSIKYDRSKIGVGTDVQFKSTDDVGLAGWFFPGTNGKAIMFVHGAGDQNRANEVYMAPEIAKHFLEQGYSILMFDLRGVGESDKSRISFGQYESRDVAGAFNYLVQQKFKPESIGILSDSLGSISTIMAADEVKNAGAIFLDSPATEVKYIISDIMEKDHNVPRFLHPGIFFMANALFKINADSVRPIDKISVLKDTPLLFFHGESDTLIRPNDTVELVSKVNKGERIVFPGAAHVETYKTNPELYLTEVGDFFAENLK